MTSPNDSIQFALGIKDPRLIFIRAFYRFNNDIKYRIFEFNLSSSQTTCSKCHQACLVKNGHFTTDVKFTTDDASHPVVLKIHKQRLRCKYCHIANKARIKAIMSIQEDRTLSCIAKDNNISPSTLNRYLDQSRSIAPRIRKTLPLMNFVEFIVNRILFALIMMDNMASKRSFRIVSNQLLRIIFKLFTCRPDQS